MQLGMIGLGRMGANMVRRLIHHGHDCVVFDMSPKAVRSWQRKVPPALRLSPNLSRNSKSRAQSG